MRVLVTGGAGFIGSHLAEAYLADGDEVVILDDLSTGFEDNLPEKATFVRGSITDGDAVERAMAGVDLVFHEAASRAVSRSVDDPLGTEEVNGMGTLRVLVAARDAGARRVVLASSSSVYGGAEQLPTPESAPLIPRSPYAVTKLAAEHHARVVSELFGVETVSLRYFNVFGPRQRPDSQYAAVIPLFMHALLAGEQPVIQGDGQQFRDFTYISNVVDANRQAATAPAEKVAGRAFNVACGDRCSILELLHLLQDITGIDTEPRFDPPRLGDVRQSCADVGEARAAFGYAPTIGLRDGLERTVDWFRHRME